LPGRIEIDIPLSALRRAAAHGAITCRSPDGHTITARLPRGTDTRIWRRQCGRPPRDASSTESTARRRPGLADADNWDPRPADDRACSVQREMSQLRRHQPARVPAGLAVDAVDEHRRHGAGTAPHCRARCAVVGAARQARGDRVSVG